MIFEQISIRNDKLVVTEIKRLLLKVTLELVDISNAVSIGAIRVASLAHCARENAFISSIMLRCYVYCYVFVRRKDYIFLLEIS